MALQKTLVSIDLTGGQDSKKKDKLVIPGKLVELSNGVFDQGGTLSKRPGFSHQSAGALLGGGSIASAPDMMAAYGAELVEAVKDSLYTLSPSRKELVPRGRAPFVSVRKKAVIRNTATQGNADHAVSGNFCFSAWEDSRGGIRYSVEETSTGALLVADAQLSATGFMPRVLVTSRNFAVVYVEGANLRIAYVVVTAPHGALTVATLQFDVSASRCMDAVVCDSANDVVFIAYNSSALELARFAYNFGVIGARQNLALGANTISAIAISRTTDARLQTWYSRSTVGLCNVVDTVAGTVTTNFTGQTIQEPTAATVNQLTVLEGATANVAEAFFLTNAGAPAALIRTCASTSAGVGVSGSEHIRHCQIAAAAFKYNGKVYLPLVFDSATGQCSVFVEDVVTRTVIAKALALSGATTNVGVQRIGSVLSLSGSRLAFPALERGRFAVQSGINTTTIGITRVELTMDRVDPMPPVVAGGVLVMPGAAPMMYDGMAAVEFGFHVYPESVVAAAGGAGLVGAGTRQICALYEWTDAKGNRHQSAPSLPVSYTNAGASQINLTLQTLTLTERYDNAGLALKPVPRANPNVVVFATEAAGTVFYRVGSVANALLSGTVAFTYNIADATLIANEVLYATGGILDNFAAPPCRTACVHDNRLFLGGTEDDGVYFSKPFVENEGIAFHPAMKLTLPDDGGEIIAPASFQEKLLVFKRDRYAIFYGAGPNAAGQGSTYTAVQSPSVGTGCVEPRSIVRGPDGMWFQSTAGLRRINPDLAVDPLAGTEMDGGAATLSPCTGAVMVADSKRKQLRFTFAGVNPMVVYDTFWGQWATFDTFFATAAAFWNSGFVFAGADVNPLATYFDNGTVWADEVAPATFNTYSLYALTPPLKFAGIQGFQRIWRLLIEGELISQPTTLVVAARWNYGEDVSTTEINQLVTGRQIRHHLSRQKCRAVAFEITMLPGAAQGYRLDNLTLEVGIKKGAFKRAQS